MPDNKCPIAGCEKLYPHLHSQSECVSNAVSSPSHYTRFPGIEVIQLARHLNFNRGNAVKYLARAGYKTGAENPEDGPAGSIEAQDVKKALWYIADECQRLGVSQEEILKIVEKHK